MRELCHRWKKDISPSIVQKLEWVKDQQRFVYKIYILGPSTLCISNNVKIIEFVISWQILETIPLWWE